MKIINDSKEPNIDIKRFKCEKCECVFEAKAREYEYREDEDLYYALCPCCHNPTVANGSRNLINGIYLLEMPAKIKIGEKVYITENLTPAHSKTTKRVRHIGYYEREEVRFELIELYKLDDSDWLCVEYEWFDSLDKEETKAIKAIYSSNNEHVIAKYSGEDKE